MDVVMMRIRWMSLFLGLALLFGGWAGAAWSQTTIERSRDIEVDPDSSLPEFEGDVVNQDDLGEGTGVDSGTPDPSGSNAIEFTPSSSSSAAPESSAIVRYNIRKNVCTGNWSLSELNSLFPSVDAAMVRDVCG